MTYETIRVEREGPLMTITLNRPDRLNAMPPQMADEIGEAFYDLGDARAVLVEGGEAVRKRAVLDFRPRTRIRLVAPSTTGHQHEVTQYDTIDKQTVARVASTS